MRFPCMRVVRFVAMLALAAGLSSWLAPGAAAKFGVRLLVSPSQPRVGRPVSILIRTGPVGAELCRMQLLAVAPGIDRFKALDPLLSGGYAVGGPQGSSFHRLRTTSRFGFRQRMQRSGPAEWNATVRFPRAGDWHVIVPNWCAPGWASPLPADRKITVRQGSSSAFPTGWAVGTGVGAVLFAGLILAAWGRPSLLERLHSRQLRSHHRVSDQQPSEGALVGSASDLPDLSSC